MDNFIKSLKIRLATYKQEIKLHKKDVCILLLLGILFFIYQVIPMNVLYAHANLVLDVFLFALPTAIFGLILVLIVLFNMTHKWGWTFMYVGCFIFMLSQVLFFFCIEVLCGLYYK